MIMQSMTLSVNIEEDYFMLKSIMFIVALTFSMTSAEVSFANCDMIIDPICGA